MMKMSFVGEGLGLAMRSMIFTVVLGFLENLIDCTLHLYTSQVYDDISVAARKVMHYLQ
ncbi:hypothetical protein L195_g012105 [Trifolium pratense]|uniref:Uncharacterized protein n=1 Tax=Trifolium pratense TaxID=57577 RepID=A0A2K3PJE4_TRIPR|nr:hypothetical protein L195_g012105 [Trifolium pratense]